MSSLPSKLKCTHHARVRLEERVDSYQKYNTKNLMKSSCKWYTNDDFIENSSLYYHSLRKLKKDI